LDPAQSQIQRERYIIYIGYRVDVCIVEFVEYFNNTINEHTHKRAALSCAGAAAAAGGGSSSHGKMIYKWVLSLSIPQAVAI
jgi:hypothetical protein